MMEPRALPWPSAHEATETAISPTLTQTKCSGTGDPTPIAVGLSVGIDPTRYQPANEARSTAIYQ